MQTESYLRQNIQIYRSLGVDAQRLRKNDSRVFFDKSLCDNYRIDEKRSLIEFFVSLLSIQLQNGPTVRGSRCAAGS